MADEKLRAAQDNLVVRAEARRRERSCSSSASHRAQASGSVQGSEVEAAAAEWSDDLARKDAATEIHQHDLDVEREAERIFQIGQE